MVEIYLKVLGRRSRTRLVVRWHCNPTSGRDYGYVDIELEQSYVVVLLEFFTHYIQHKKNFDEDQISHHSATLLVEVQDPADTIPSKGPSRTSYQSRH